MGVDTVTQSSIFEQKKILHLLSVTYFNVFSQDYRNRYRIIDVENKETHCFLNKKVGLGLIKVNDVSANFNNPRPSLILNN